MKRKEIMQVFDRIMREYPAKIRLQHYVHEAERQQRTESRVDELQLIKELLAQAREARQAIDSQDLDHFAQAFERVMRRAIALKIRDLETSIKKTQGEYVKELEDELANIKAGWSEGGRKKAAQSPKLAAKIRVYHRWKDYNAGKKLTYISQLGSEVKYKNKTDFARQNEKMEDALESQFVIERWCRDWCKGKDIAQLVDDIRNSQQLLEPGSSMKKERTFIHHKTGAETKKKTGNIGRKKPAQHRIREITALAVEGNSSAQIGPLIGVTPEYVRRLAREYDIPIPGDVNRRRLALNIKPERVIDEICIALDGCVMGMGLIQNKLEQITPEKAQIWADEFSASLKPINSLYRTLKGIANG